MRNSAASCCVCGRDGFATIVPGMTLAARRRAVVSTFDVVSKPTFNMCISSTTLRNSDFSGIAEVPSGGSALTRPGLRSRHCSTEFMKQRFWRSLARPRGKDEVDCMPSADMTRAFSRDDIVDASPVLFVEFVAGSVEWMGRRISSDVRGMYGAKRNPGGTGVGTYVLCVWLIAIIDAAVRLASLGSPVAMLGDELDITSPRWPRSLSAGYHASYCGIGSGLASYDSMPGSIMPPGGAT